MNTMRSIAHISVAQPELSDNDIVSEENQNRLMYWRDVLRMGQFDIGDVAVEEITRNAQAERQVTQERIFRAIGRFCGKTERTVRYYYETAVFYETEVRQEFNILPFSHFVEARSFGKRWREFLERSMIYPGHGIEFIRNQMVAANFSVPVAADFSAEDESGRAEKDKTDPVENADGKTDNESDNANKKDCEVSQSIPGKAIAHDRLSVVTGVLSRLPELKLIVENTEMPDWLKDTATNAIYDLERTLPMVSRSLV